MEPQHGPDGPPPPYSETDIYSHSHASRNNHMSGADDDVSIAPSSSHSNIIDTPPESPLDSQFGFADSGNGDQHITASSQDYFDSRPPNQPSGPSITVGLDITPDSAPSDFPYPEWAAGRDVTQQDWQTFINYLLPGHEARANSHIIDRKLRFEGDAPSSAHDGITKTQLASLTSSASATISPQSIDTVTREWNHGFFEPRGVTIRRTPPAVPVAEPQIQEPETSRVNPAGEEQSQSQPQQQSSWWRNPFGFVDGRNGSVRVGSLHIDGDRVAFGSSFEADSDGVRCWHGQPNGHTLFEASSRGVRWGQQPGPGRGHPHPHPFGHRGGYGWPGPFGGGRGRGRGFGHEHRHEHGRRDHSRSSTSSSSSSISSNSDSSIGSLPDWDDLKDVQLPVTKHTVQVWLAHPDQPVTKDMLKKAKAEIKAAKNIAVPPRDSSWDNARGSLRREVKDLLQQFKVLKRQQRSAKRRARKELRQQRRASRQERRNQRRAERHDRRAHEHENRRAERETRRAERDADRHARRFRHHHMPPPPPGPSVPGVASPPPPPPPPAFPGFGGFFNRGSFGPRRPPPPPGFPFGRGFDQHRGSSPWEQAAEHANRVAAEAVSTAQKEVEEALARAEADREKALATARAEREKAAQVVEESYRSAMEAVERSRATAGRARDRDNSAALAAERRRVAAEENRRAAAEAASRAAFDAKLAEARTLESQMSAKVAQVEALEVRIADAEGKGKKKQSEKEKETDSSSRTNLENIKRLKADIESLTRRVEALKVEADEEFAWGLAERVDEQPGWK
ncbi:hypothetical protein GQX73_g9572 [Xylaria multiplex]|uniref:Uncharacterized protein n=1 Tax=Xylaria multiplex TaxID=323545 RepID=A0A7C8IHT8_9PEZI|nr:hypothetical protein GQX73_g9572 [Xylaria multiplex]